MSITEFHVFSLKHSNTFPKSRKQKDRVLYRNVNSSIGPMSVIRRELNWLLEAGK